MAILKAADAIRRRMHALVGTRGITFQQYNVIRILRGARHGPLAAAQIARRTIEVVPDISALLEDLERKGFAQPHGVSGDAGAAGWSVTPSGLELLAELEGPVADADRGSIAGLAEDELRGVIALLERVRANS